MSEERDHGRPKPLRTLAGIAPADVPAFVAAQLAGAAAGALAARFLFDEPVTAAA